MQSDVAELGDDINDWIPEFKGQQIDGVVLVSGDSVGTVENSIAKVHRIFTIDTLEEIITLTGNVRPGNEKGHEQ